MSAYTLLDHPGQQQERLEMVTDLWRMTSDVLVSFFPVVCVCVAWVCVGEHTCICVCTRACVHACLCCYVSVMVCMEDPCLVEFESTCLHCLHTHYDCSDIVGTNEWLTDICYACPGSGGKWHISWLLTD